MNHHDHNHDPARRGSHGDGHDHPGDPRPDEGFGPGRGGRRTGRGRWGGPGPEGFRGGRRGPRARGDVRAAILLLLEEQPRHGYELIQEITERSSGSWTPSPGSIYPTLQAMEDEGLVTIAPVDGRRTASLTDHGVEYVEANRERLGDPWAVSQLGHGPALALRQEIGALKDAVTQVARVGTPTQHTAAAAVLVTARKELYRLLAEDVTSEG